MLEANFWYQILDLGTKHYIAMWNGCAQSVYKWLHRISTTRALTHIALPTQMFAVQKWVVFTLEDSVFIPLKRSLYTQVFELFNRLSLTFMPTIHSAYKNKDKLNLDKYIIERVS
jgi:hypothetical protein